MTPADLSIVDGDGHVFEDYDGLRKRMPAIFQNELARKRSIFPDLGHLHVQTGVTPPTAFNAVGPDGWRKFATDLSIKAAVLFPSFGLGFSAITNIQWARAAARAYNDWLYDTYVAGDPHFRGMALVPTQDPQAAAAELRRCVGELGFCGAVLPTSGIQPHFGRKEYWPLYEAANELGCAIAFHGGAHESLGLESMETFAAVHALGHPFGILVNFAGLTFNGVFDRFPNIRFAFLEAGVAWLMMALERFESSHRAFIPYDPDGELLKLPARKNVAEYLIELMRARRVFVGVEGDEPQIPYAIRTVGREAFVFSSDFPHEVNTDICRHEIEEILENDELNDDDKRAILQENAEWLYGLNKMNAAKAAS
jgi:predicted TIM-barrel fold metal-dependent hydrolase